MYKLTTDIEKLIRIFYENIELGNDDIREIFEGVSMNTIQRLKSDARKVMVERNVMPWDKRRVNTQCAYAAWGLDIADLELRYAKLQNL